MRRFRYWLLRLRLTTTRLTSKAPRVPRQAVRNVLVFWVLIIGVVGIAATTKLRPTGGGFLATLAMQQWHAAVDKAADALPHVDELVIDKWPLSTVALQLALPAGTVSDARAAEEQPSMISQAARWILRFATGVDPWDPASMIARELSGVGDVAASLALVSWTPTSPSRNPSSSTPSSTAPSSAPSAAASSPPRSPSGESPSTGSVHPADVDAPSSPSSESPPPTIAMERMPAGEPLPDDERTLPGGDTPPSDITSDDPWERLRAVSWGDECRVLIYHTHTSEMYRTDSFAPSAADQYHVFNTADTGIVTVGRAIKEHLEQFGIPSCHLTNVHDWPSHPRAYIEARATVEQFLRHNPQIDIVMDVHRDAPPGLVATVGGHRAAQLAFVVGTHAGMHPRWPENVAFGRALAELIEERFPGLFRRVIERPDARLNQDLHPRAILVEIGSYDTHLNEALLSAELFAEIIADMLHIIRFGHSVVDGTGSVR